MTRGLAGPVHRWWAQAGRVASGWVWALDLLEGLGQSLLLSEPQFPHLGSNGGDMVDGYVGGEGLGALLSLVNSVVINWVPTVCCSGHKGRSSDQDSPPSWGSHSRR